MNDTFWGALGPVLHGAKSLLRSQFRRPVLQEGNDVIDLLVGQVVTTHGQHLRREPFADASGKADWIAAMPPVRPEQRRAGRAHRPFAMTPLATARSKQGLAAFRIARNAWPRRSGNQTK
jgi:hypothetical protein